MAKVTNTAEWQTLDEIVDELPAGTRGRKVDPNVLARAEAAIADLRPRRITSPEGESAEEYAKRAVSVIATLRKVVAELDPSLTVSQRSHSGWIYWYVKSAKS